MLADDATVLAQYDPTPPAIPPRSRLFSLPPVGIGTPAVESLTGYVARLASMHGVPVRRLVEDEILPLLGRSYLLSPRKTSHSSSFWQHSETRAVNGTGTLARDVVRVIQTLTRQENLCALTLRPWAEVLPVTGLLRRQRAWCPACYEQWRQAGTAVYEPLLWAVAPLTTCPRHWRPLQQTCPYPDCRRPLPLLGPHSSPGCCSACGRWLGLAAEGRRGAVHAVTAEERQAQSWVDAALGELLAGAPSLATYPTRLRLAHVVAVYVEEVASGNVTQFARELGLNMHTVAQWRWGTTVPSLALLLQACFRLGTTPWHLLTDDLEQVPRSMAQRPHLSIAHLVDVPCRSRSVRRAFDSTAMRSALEAILAGEEQPPPPMRQVARRLGHTHAELIQHLPALCHAISARYLADRQRRAAEKKRHLCAEVRQAAMHLHDQGIYPSACRIAPLISQPGFIRNPVASAERKAVLRDLGWRP